MVALRQRALTLAALSPVVLSSLLIAAHFMRMHWIAVTVVCALVPLLLLIRQRWTIWVIQLFLVLAGMEWIRVTSSYVTEREAYGQPYLRLMIILALVTLFTLGSGLVFKIGRVDARYR